MNGRRSDGIESELPGDADSQRFRDRQRAKVYDAENLVHRIFARSAEFPEVDIAGSRLTLPVERHFATLESVQSYVDAVLCLGAVRARWPRAKVSVEVRERRGQRQADYQRLTGVLSVPLHSRNQAWALRELVILHELTHHLAESEEEPHGPAFTERLIALSGLAVGPEAGFLLQTTMWDNGVRIG